LIAVALVAVGFGLRVFVRVRPGPAG
jgi:hypothetical protein